MLLYLVQHAEAKSKEQDPARGLSGKGIQDITKVAEYAAKLNINISEIFHSGKTRALETSRVLADYLIVKKGISETDGLAPLDDPQIWFNCVSNINEDVMLVGHLPHLAKLSALILCKDKDKNIIDFKMAGIVCLKRFENGQWSVEWMITPEVCT